MIVKRITMVNMVQMKWMMDKYPKKHQDINFMQPIKQAHTN